jgi:hypothetical protein
MLGYDGNYIKTIVIEPPYKIKDEMYITCEVNGCGYILNTIGLDFNETKKQWFQITKEEALKRGLKVFER